MILLTKQGRQVDIPRLHAYKSGVWSFQFYGDETYIDPVDDEEAYYSFYDSADIGRDSTDNRNDGTATDVTQTIGPFDYAGNFNVSTSSLVAPMPVSDTSICTLAFWISTSEAKTLANKRIINSLATFGMQLDLCRSFTTNSVLYVRDNAGSSDYIDLGSGGIPNDGNAHSIVIEINGDTLNYYIDNSLFLTTTHTTNYEVFHGDLTFYGLTVLFELAELHIFTRILTDAERTALYENNGWNTWNWENVNNNLLEILAVYYNGAALTPTLSLADCTALQSSFFWNDANGYFYVQWPGSIGDWAVGRDISSYSELYAGYASGYSKTSKNYYGGLFFDPILIGFSGMDKKTDLTKLGLISFGESSFILSNEGGRFDGLADTEAIGTAAQFFYIPEDVTTFDSTDQVFTGTQYGYKNDRSKTTIKVIENRLYKNNPVCPNVATVANYADIGDKESALLPVAWGELRKGIALPVNLDNLETASSGTATLLLADPALGELTQVDYLYDENGDSVTGLTIDLTACTVSFTKAADIAPSALSSYTWAGRGYVISGTYNNGLDIIKHAFEVLAGVPFLESTFDRSTWNLETLNNTASIGISIQSDKGFIEELIEPITTSLQGIVDIRGDGRISYQSRDDSALVLHTVEQYQQTAEPQLDEVPDSIVSEILVQYAPNFKDSKNDFLQYLYTDERSTVIKNFGIDRRDPLSPVESVLTEEADAEALAIELMDTSNQGETTPIIQKVEINQDLQIFDIIGVDTGRHEVNNYEYGEILKIQPDYIQNIEKITLRLIDTEDANLPLYHQGRIMGTALAGTALLGYTRIRETI